MSKPTFGSLFAGIGGIDRGLENAGWACRWQVEVEPFCQAVLAAHWPHVARYGDIKRTDIEQLAEVDLIAGGFPCQPHSVAGKRKGQADERWLWPWFAAVIASVGPRYVLIENVPGLRSSGLRDVLADLASLGFDAEWSTVSACAVGAPHLRKRMFVLAYPYGERLEGPRRKRRLDDSTHAEVKAAGESWWFTEPGMDRVVDGVPDRVDRLKALGNAAVPQVVEVLGRRLLAMT
jgi:DNA (cytosine-5)-methyltransferase 1